MKLWEKNYKLNEKVETYTVGNDYCLDKKLVKYDCIASIAHVKMLKKIGILSSEECTNMINVLNDIILLHSTGKFYIQKEDEDCHTAIEKYLVRKLGDVGKKVHTARSRNDQVVTALRLYYKEELTTIIKLIDVFIETLGYFKAKYGYIEWPGFTHMRKAMPSSVRLWAYAFIESMMDNKHVLSSVYSLIDQSPLGTGAGYELPINIDRKYTAELLHFNKVQQNPIYVQNSRGKFEASILHALSQVMYDLNKMASDLLLFSMSEFDFVTLADDICTGSSIMPQKKNPDVLELVRAQYHQLLSYEFQVKGMTANLISGYNRDLQLTKQASMMSIDLTKDTIAIMNIIIEKLQVNKHQCKKAMTEELYATKKLYDLVGKGIPFRDAYKEISKSYIK